MNNNVARSHVSGIYRLDGSVNFAAILLHDGALDLRQLFYKYTRQQA